VMWSRFEVDQIEWSYIYLCQSSHNQTFPWKNQTCRTRKEMDTAIGSISLINTQGDFNECDSF
jgi:hypothetical protein